MLSRLWKGPNSSNWETRWNRFFDRAAWALDYRKNIDLSDELGRLLPKYLPFRDQALKLAADLTQGDDIQHNERRIISYLRAAKWAHQRDGDAYERGLAGQLRGDELDAQSQISWQEDAWPLDIPQRPTKAALNDPRIWEPMLTTAARSPTNPRGRYQPKR